MKKATSFNYSRTVTYDGTNHLSVILQRYGSINPKVLPYCLFNVSVAVLVLILRRFDIVDLTISEFGHEFMGLLVAFLVVSRASTTFSLYFEFRGYLEALFQSTRSIVELTLSYEWRPQLQSVEITYTAMRLLESSVLMMAGEDTTTTRADNVAATSFTFRNYTTDYHPCDSQPKQQQQPQPRDKFGTPNNKRWSHNNKATKASDLNLNMTLRHSYQLRKLLAEKQLDHSVMAIYHTQQALDQYLNAYYGIRKYLTTPYPFPLVQMARFVLFLYVFTLPFALPSTNTSVTQAILLVFIVSYGFLGIEQVSIELDNPFGNDPSDFPIKDMAEEVYDEIGWMVHTHYGEDAVEHLRNMFQTKSSTVSQLQVEPRIKALPNEETSLL